MATREPKLFRLSAADIRPLATGRGSCLATDQITVDGKPVGFMYREAPDNSSDSGWRFFSGEESQEYTDRPENLEIHDVNTIANYDRAIIKHLDAPVGSAFGRNASNEFAPEEMPDIPED